MEQMVLPALAMGGYEVRRGVDIGSRLGIGRHRIDILATEGNGRIHLVSLKWQQVAGTAEQKIPFEVISLIDAMKRNEDFYKAHLVLGGNGWKFKEFYFSGGMNPFLIESDRVNILSLEEFVTKANQRQL